MPVFKSALLGLLAALPIAGQAKGQDAPWSGTWITNRGILELNVADDGSISGTLDKNDVRGEANGLALNYEVQFKKNTENGALKLDKNSGDLSGNYGRNGKWQGWKQRFGDDDVGGATDGDPEDFSGVWLTSSGTIVVEQSDNGSVKGSIGPEGWSSINRGKVKGGKMEFKWTIRNFKGTGWFEVSKDKQHIYGVMKSKNSDSAWTGLRPDGYEQNVKPIAGKVVQGVAANGMLYNLRMPNGWKEGQKVDAIVLMHGSNWTTSGMVPVTAKNWPELGKKFAIIGIQGQSWAKWSGADDLRFNFTYINWVGRSTLGGFPYTDRESPFLVGNLLDEFKEAYAIDRYFVGGHSQGGYLTYMMAMHFPEKIAGTFPMAGGLIVQAEPDVFDDEELKTAQRETPMYILHGSKDNVVAPSMGRYAYNRLLSHDFTRVVLSQPNRGHPYDFLPVDEAITWLDMMSTNDKAALLAYGKKQVLAKNWRNAGLVIDRAAKIKGGKPFSMLWRAYEKAAAVKGAKLKASIEANADGSWASDYLAWQEQFIFSTKQKDTIDAFQKLRDEHDEPANKLYGEARKAFRKGEKDAGYAKYEELAEKYYAARRYAAVKRVLDER